MAEDYCELCDLPKSTCIHGQPPPPPPAPAVRTPRPRASRATTSRTTSTPAAPVRKPSLLTDQAAFRPHILQVLSEHGGRLDQADVLEALGQRMDDVLRDRDRTTAPTGEVRWQIAARKERKAMIDEGLMRPATPGVWELTEKGLRSL
ncbi:hypothetical protein [Nocardioides sp. SYSU D00038]|uniref:hypothetical protein n=1 Tax=Nocardioides sp. SYSU D00038 TaxID=2812554 RepID=UPI00196878D6|nr:hypothetical protein [Nocardioides sp. SYSU D00038]